VASLNPKVIAELRALETGGTPGQVRELIDLFLRETDGHARSLRAAVDGRDRTALDRSAQALKGGSGNLGAMALARICAELQGFGRSGAWERAAALLPGLDAELRSVRSELKTERANP
jgi:HPt (histidine-containing phosphotransfer) domain-containing protein